MGGGGFSSMIMMGDLVWEVRMGVGGERCLSRSETSLRVVARNAELLVFLRVSSHLSVCSSIFGLGLLRCLASL